MRFFLLFLCAVLAASCTPTRAQTVVTYPAPAPDSSFFIEAKNYRVAVNGKPVFVYDFDPQQKFAKIPASMDPQPTTWKPAVFGSFDFAGKITVSVTCPDEVKSAVIRPKSLGIVPKWNGKTVSFELSQPANFGLEINGDGTQPLFLFANPILPKPNRNDPNVVWVEGGKIYENHVFPNLGGKTLYIEGGAIVRLKDTIGGGKDLSNTKILGTGIVTGSEPTRDQHLFGWTHPAKNFEMNGPIFVSTHRGGKWAVVPTEMDGAKFTNIKVFGLFRDAFDPNSSSNLLVDRCFFWSHDDALVIKAHQWANKPVRNITVQNTTTWNHGLMIGFETNAPFFENISFKNCDIVRYWGNTGNPLNPKDYFALRNPVIGIAVSDQAHVSNIRYEDIRVEAPWTDTFFQFMVDKNYATTHSEAGSISGVFLKNLSVFDTDSRIPTPYGSEARGLSANHGISDVLIEGFTWNGREITTLDEAKFWKNEHVSNLQIQPLAPRTGVPSAPTQLQIEARAGFRNRLSWRDNAGNEDGFLIERRESGGDWQPLARVVANQSQFFDRDLRENSAHDYRIRAFNERGNSPFSNLIGAKTLGQMPFRGVAHAVPGTIEAEDFDEGGQGVSWLDKTGGNSAGHPSAGRYRNEVDPDIGPNGEGFNIGWTDDGDWLEYTLDVKQSAVYDFEVWVASGGEGGKLSLQIDGKVAGDSLAFAGTGGWGEGHWKAVAQKGVKLEAGTRVLRVQIERAGFNLDKIHISPSG